MVSSATIDFAIRLGFIALLGYWSFRVIAPFLTIGLWSAILAVALYPVFDWLARWLSPRAAALLVTLLCFMVVVGPLTWLALGMIGGVSSLVKDIDTGQLTFPLPPEAVKGWPIIGERLHQLWQLAATNMKEALAEVAPMLKPAGGQLLVFAQGALFGLIELLVAIIIAGFLFTRGPMLVDVLSAFVSRALSHRGKELVQLAGATIRNVSRGVVGIALLQSLLAGAGFLARRHSGRRCARLRCPSLEYRTDRTGDPVSADRHLELDGDGHDECPNLHGLYGSGRADRQCAQAVSDGAWACHAHAGDRHRRHRRYNSPRDRRIVLWPNRTFRRLGGVGGLATGKRCRRGENRFPARAEPSRLKATYN